MRSCNRLVSCVAVLCGWALLPAMASAETKVEKTARPRARKTTEISSRDAKFPEKVRKTFDEKFPNATIQKVEAEKEGGVMVYDVEFREGQKYQETDIADDGTMLETTLVVKKKSLPKAVAASLEKAADGAKMVRLEKINVTHETKDGKIIKLDKPKTQYAAEMTKGDKNGEVVVDEKGKVVEEPKWEAPKAAAKKPA